MTRSVALIAYIGLFGPGVILIFAIVPFWARLRHVLAFKAILKGVNATAIGVSVFLYGYYGKILLNHLKFNCSFCSWLVLHVLFFGKKPCILQQMPWFFALP